MSNLAEIFTGDAKVVISPDEMRAWVMLPPPPKGVKYTVDATAQWLEENKVVYGVSREMIRDALDSGRTYELLEVARGDAAQDATAGSYELCIERKPFTGLRANTDGSLIYDDLSFLTEVPAGTPLAHVIAADPGKAGTTVTGQPVEPRAAEGGRELKGSGFVLNEAGTQYVAPVLSHISFVNEELVVTPLRKEESWAPEQGKLTFDGNVVVEKDIHSGCEIEVTGSLYVEGRTLTAEIKAGRNVLLGKGMRGAQGFGNIVAGEYIWGMVFESATIKAGRDLHANHLQGCEVTVEGRCVVLGGRGQIANTTLYAREGVVCAVLGNEMKSGTVLRVGMSQELIDRYEGVERRMVKTTQDIQSLQQNITAYEKINRMKPDKGKSAPEYKEMVTRKEQQLKVLQLLDAERTRTKRTIEAYSAVNVIARSRVFPGVTIVIDTRSYEVERPLQRVKFKRDGDIVEAIESPGQ